MNYQLKVWYSKRKLFAAQTPLVRTFNYANYYAEKYASMFQIQKSQKALRKRPLRLELYKGGYQGSFKLLFCCCCCCCFTKKISHASKSTKITKAQKRNRAKAQNANERTKIKSSLKKHPRGKKLLIRLFAFLCLRRKKIEKSLQSKCWSH